MLALMCDKDKMCYPQTDGQNSFISSRLRRKLLAIVLHGWMVDLECQLGWKRPHTASARQPLTGALPQRASAAVPASAPAAAHATTAARWRRPAAHVRPGSAAAAGAGAAAPAAHHRHARAAPGRVIHGAGVLDKEGAGVRVVQVKGVALLG